MKNQYRIIVMMIVACMTTTIAVGCGEGKGRNKQRLQRTFEAGKGGTNTDAAAGTDAAAAADADAAEEQAPPAGEGDDTAGMGGQEEVAQKSAQLEQIASEVDALKSAGTTIDRHALEDGTYKLSEVASSVYYQYKSEELRALQILTLDSSNRLSEKSQANVGVATEHAIEARTLEIANEILVKKVDGKFTAERSAFGAMMLNTAVNAMDGKITSNTSTSPADATPIDSSILTILQSGEAQGSSDITYSLQDEAGKSMVLRLRKVSETELRIVVSVTESATSASNLEAALVHRDIVLTYTFEKAEEKAALVLEETASGTGTDDDLVDTTATTTDASASGDLE